MYYKDILPNGMRVITQEMPDVYSVTSSIWVETGSAYEDDYSRGLSHFLEHMLFKGTETRSAQKIAEIMEEVGAQMNAFTSKEYTCFYVKSLSEHFNLSMDVLSDMYLHSVIDEEEFDKEKGVILEEINMYEDTPDDLVSEIYFKNMWQNHTYGLPVIGNSKSVSDMTAADLRKYYHEKYRPNHTVIVVAGNVKREEVLEVVTKFLGDYEGTWDRPQLEIPENFVQNAYVKKDIEQSHLIFGVPALPGKHDDVYKVHVLASVLGGGTCSRLFQEIREKRGLTYSVYTSNACLANGGTLFSYASTSPKNVDEVMDIFGREMTKIRANGITEQELKIAQAGLKCGMLMGLENSANVMARLGKAETLYGEVLEIDQIVEKIMAVTLEDVHQMAKELLRPERFMFAQVGTEEYKKDIKTLF